MKFVLLGILLILVPPSAVICGVTFLHPPAELGKDLSPQLPPGLPLSISAGGAVHLGEVPVGEAVTWFFEISNIGDEPVSFDEPKTNCTCLEAQIGARLLAPDESTQVRMVHSPNRIGDSASTANVIVHWSGGSSNIPLRVQSSGTVVPKQLSLNPEIVDIGDIRSQTSAHFSLQLNSGDCPIKCSDLVFDFGDRTSWECDSADEGMVTVLYEGLGELPFGAFSLPIRARSVNCSEGEAEVVLVGRKLPEGAVDWPGCFVLLEEGGRSSKTLRFPGVTITGIGVSGSDKIEASIANTGNSDTVSLLMKGASVLVDVAIVSLATSVGEIQVRVVASDSEVRLDE